MLWSLKSEMARRSVKCIDLSKYREDDVIYVDGNEIDYNDIIDLLEKKNANIKINTIKMIYIRLQMHFITDLRNKHLT